MEGEADAQSLIRERWKGVRVIQLEGSVRVSPDDIAAAFSSALGRPVHAQPVPRETWDALFRAQGMHSPLPRIRMLDGFNEGWIGFHTSDDRLKGEITVAEVIGSLVRAARFNATTTEVARA
jgi:NAD(P)H dehydrogenase (quinone)